MVKAATLSKNQSVFLYIFIIGLFIIQPIGALILQLFICYATTSESNKIWKWNIIIFIVLSILLLAIINSSKVNANDLYYYILWFKQSAKSGFFEYVSNQPKKSESAYAAYVWFVNHIISPRQEIYKFITTVIQYIFLSLASIKLCNKIPINKAIVMATIALTCFNPYVFSLSIQLLRQSLAVSIFIYVMVERCLYGKNNWILIALCPMIHTMTLLLVILLFIPILKKPIKKHIWGYSIVLLVIGSIRVISGYLLKFSIFSDSTASYALKRASAEKGFDLGEATPITILLVIIILATSFYCAHIKTAKSNTSVDSGLRLLFNIPAIVSVFVLLNVNMSEIFARFLMLLYPFIPLIFAGLFIRMKLNKILSLLGSISLILLFIYLTKHSVWAYTNLDQVLKSGLLYLI